MNNFINKLSIEARISRFINIDIAGGIHLSTYEFSPTIEIDIDRSMNINPY